VLTEPQPIECAIQPLPPPQKKLIKTTDIWLYIAQHERHPIGTYICSVLTLLYA
jgi:hypothetical protein